jgi:hypothetical protein
MDDREGKVENSCKQMSSSVYICRHVLSDIAVSLTTAPEHSGERKGQHTGASNVINPCAVLPADNRVPMLVRVHSTLVRHHRAMRSQGWMVVLPPATYQGQVCESKTPTEYMGIGLGVSNNQTQQTMNITNDQPKYYQDGFNDQDNSYMEYLEWRYLKQSWVMERIAMLAMKMTEPNISERSKKLGSARIGMMLYAMEQY